MQQVQFETSMKNIPLGGKKEYVMQLHKSVRKVVYAMSLRRQAATQDACALAPSIDWPSFSLVTISIFMYISFNPSVADDPSGATVCTTME